MKRPSRPVQQVDPVRPEGVPPGHIIIEGDIIVPENFLNPLVAATYATNLWPGGVVPYEFDANVSTLNRSRTLDAMAEWEARANIDFRPRAGDPNYLHIQDSTGNSSFVGMQGGGQVLNMFNWSFKYIIAHELAHALGYWHEQSRADRDAYVQINYANIQAGYAHNFDIRPSPGGEVGPYDFDSTRTYPKTSLSSRMVQPR